ncbi:MAG: hypothetical protein ACLUWN_02330 [Clostridia bacterium]
MENCLHCEKGQAKYCEKCYQDLITENTKLQIDKNKLFEYKYYDEQNNLIAIINRKELAKLLNVNEIRLGE